MGEIVRYSGCFVCGDKNPDGLRLVFVTDGEDAVSECVADPKFQGYRGIYHGGLVSTLLDEIMAKAVLAKKKYALTVEMSVRFKKAVTVGDRLQLRGRVTSQKGRLLETEGELTAPDGTVFATATGKYLEATGQSRDRLLESLE